MQEVLHLKDCTVYVQYIPVVTCKSDCGKNVLVKVEIGSLDFYGENLRSLHARGKQLNQGVPQKQNHEQISDSRYYWKLCSILATNMWPTLVVYCHEQITQYACGVQCSLSWTHPHTEFHIPSFCWIWSRLLWTVVLYECGYCGSPKDRM
jgi:hypothetical protein